MQTRTMSMIETIASTAVGFIISWLLLWFLSIGFGWSNSVERNTLVTLLFTVASLLRGYGVRRFFNWLQANGRRQSVAK